MHEALYYQKLENGKVRCDLCPWFCELQPGQTGICKVRTNENGKLVTEVYNKVAAMGVDPIEKKPLYHFHPGKNILSIGEVGCNLQCSFCQNHHISQCHASAYMNFEEATAEQIVREALKTNHNAGIAYTYNEPLTFYEFLLDTAKLAHKNGLKNVVISNGYINQEPLKELLPYIDAFNIDLKSFTNSFYKKYTKGQLSPVLETLKTIAESNTHLEITYLVIPGLNDDETEFKSMINWIVTVLGEKTPLHLSRFHPQYKLELASTPIEKLELFYEIAKKQLPHVYLGNVSDEKRSATYCAKCGVKLISRKRYRTEIKSFLDEIVCKNCGTTINIHI